MVLELCETDLHRVSYDIYITLSLGQKKGIVLMLFNALSFMHSKRILHRDIKPSNILIDKNGVIKLADFGNSVVKYMADDLFFEGSRIEMPDNMTTLWYQAPEILLGDRFYSFPVDSWSAGCAIMELWQRRPFLNGIDVPSQINLIMDLCGSFSPYKCHDFRNLKHTLNLKLQKNQSDKYKEKILSVVIDEYAYDFIKNLLNISPNERLDAHAALKHKFLTFCSFKFRSFPLPDPNLIEIISAHIYNTLNKQPKTENFILLTD
ncbi:Cyclin-dependent kinase 9 [Thelohanellus kitauei]|uniref:Cyclin-dependent kinase 9 n=1 Tax=Thelohanellus kitauei TaxID=669202 RepID=A0A0C2N4C0_THEKT|nr:Cyclin-dependent kinase 9 [Thelohanellus kitauei]